MLLLLIFLFTVVPVLELYLLIKIGSMIGSLQTISIVLVTGIVGATLAKSQGRQIFSNLQMELSQGKMPTNNIVAGMLVFAGGLLLLTPGFITDILGLSFVFPGTRYFWVRFFRSYFARQIKTGRVHVYTNMQGFPRNPGGTPPYGNFENDDEPRVVKEINPQNKSGGSNEDQ